MVNWDKLDVGDVKKRRKVQKKPKNAKSYTSYAQRNALFSPIEFYGVVFLGFLGFCVFLLNFPFYMINPGASPIPVKAILAAQADTPPPTSLVARDGTSLSYRVWLGSVNSLPVLVFIPGEAATSQAFVALAPLLTKHAHVIAVDQRGNGLTGHNFTTDYVEQHLDDLEDLLEGVHGLFPNSKILLGGHGAGFLSALGSTARPSVTDKVAGFLGIAPLVPSSGTLD